LHHVSEVDVDAAPIVEENYGKNEFGGDHDGSAGFGDY